jgi:pseudouridine-5'-phosphate glycosidase/pseudouridine kinase
MAEAAHRSFQAFDPITDSSGTLPAKDSRTLLVAPLGHDSFGTLIREKSREIGMRTDGFLQAKQNDQERSSPVCNMVLSESGDLVGGVADFSALDTLTPQEVSPLGNGLS